jgi:hypothetical protein
MPKYINLDDYCENVCKCNADSCDKEKCPLWAAPACDVVEVVRCKDCRHYIGCGIYDGKSVHACSYMRIMKLPYDFCSYGERK